MKACAKLPAFRIALSFRKVEAPQSFYKALVTVTIFSLRLVVVCHFTSLIDLHDLRALKVDSK